MNLSISLVLVSAPVVLIKDLDKSNLREKDSFWLTGQAQSIMSGQSRQELKGSCPRDSTIRNSPEWYMEVLSLSSPFIQSQAQFSKIVLSAFKLENKENPPQTYPEANLI